MGRDEVLKTFEGVVSDPLGSIKEYKEKEKKPVVGYFCTYTPEEMIHAAGAIPFRIIGENKAVERADGHLQSYSCSLIRTGLDLALLGKLDFVDGTVFPHTCDSIQRLSDIWKVNAKIDYHADVVLPVKLNTESAKKYLIEELGAFRKSLDEHFSTTVSDKKLRESIKVYNEMRDNLSRLYRIKNEAPKSITARDVNNCVKAAMYMPVEEHNRLMAELLADLDKGAKDEDAPRVIFSGNLCVFPEILDFVEKAGAYVVGDDMCTGYRYFVTNVDEKKGDDLGPIEAIADRIIKRPICAAKHNPDFDRGEFLKSLAREVKAEGVVFLFLKFCDPHSFDYPRLMKSLDEVKIPHILIETEMDNPALGQLRTRIEAFVEMIRDNR
ncbi:MAG: 2-hydroxyacyl-CoA dehydratase [Deltaproteobacteria bacterium]|uniref:2-hydroxyacyl-CoA dehydratase n=1 Tax=Candidatus Zymogenus saltonus TaxID=2844893 RepID=A0A9D8PNX7_9DELT|nr:2-hydroxyacyl-CoA dehydratase [Candidatus Zymogenus saltonus]